MTEPSPRRPLVEDDEFDTAPVATAVSKTAAERDQADPDTDRWPAAAGYLPPASAPAGAADDEWLKRLAHPGPTHRSRPHIIAAVAGVLLIVVAASIAGWYTMRPSPKPAPPPPVVTPSARQAHLTQLLPAGYAPGSCQPAPPPARATGMALCGPNTDRGGPTTSAYTLADQTSSLPTLFNDLLGDSVLATCPGNIQSPGPWRHTATPHQISGTLACSYRSGLAVVTWTTDATLLVSQVNAGRGGPTLEQLYQWWSTHS